VASLLLLELEAVLERLATRIPPDEIFTFAKFLLLTAVVLPILPRQEFSRFHINPFKTWLVVVAVYHIVWQLGLTEGNEATWRGGGGRDFGRGILVDSNNDRPFAKGCPRRGQARYKDPCCCPLVNRRSARWRATKLWVVAARAQLCQATPFASLA
jgi:hypothetical protein